MSLTMRPNEVNTEVQYDCIAAYHRHCCHDKWKLAAAAETRRSAPQTAPRDGGATRE